MWTLFFGMGDEEDQQVTGSFAQLRVQMAKAVCGMCPSLHHCRADAMKSPPRYGVIAGASERDRRNW